MMQKLLSALALLLFLVVVGGCEAENVHNSAPRTDEDNAYLQEMDDKVAEEEQGS